MTLFLVGITNRVGGREIDIKYHTEEKTTPSKTANEQRPSSTTSNHSQNKFSEETPGGSSDKKLRMDNTSMKWPGIEAVIEAYQKHNEGEAIELYFFACIDMYIA